MQQCLGKMSDMRRGASLISSERVWALNCHWMKSQGVAMNRKSDVLSCDAVYYAVQGGSKF